VGTHFDGRHGGAHFVGAQGSDLHGAVGQENCGLQMVLQGAGAHCGAQIDLLGAQGMVLHGACGHGATLHGAWGDAWKPKPVTLKAARRTALVIAMSSERVNFVDHDRIGEQTSSPDGSAKAGRCSHSVRPPTPPPLSRAYPREAIAHPDRPISPPANGGDFSHAGLGTAAEAPGQSSWLTLCPTPGVAKGRYRLRYPTAFRET
jgi:hypothetical protein